METVSEQKCFGGTQGYYMHTATTTRCDMTFSVFVPAKEGRMPVLWYLSGLTCTAHNATEKAGFQRLAAELGLIIVCPDTSPRGKSVPDDEAYDFGQGAGFYVNATEAPWQSHFKMYDYVTAELPMLIKQHFPADMARQGIFGHSMGGHGALTLAFNMPDRFKSVSAFAPIVSPINCPWGQKAMMGFLGSDQSNWVAHDACALIEAKGALFDRILVDQGLSDPFLTDQLKPKLLADACMNAEQPLELRQHEGYDHSYYFIASFIADHLRFHHSQLGA